MTPEMRAAVDRFLALLPLDETGHVTDCGFDDDETCGCYSLPERIAAVLDAHVAAALTVAPIVPCARCGNSLVFNPRPDADLIVCEDCAYRLGYAAALTEALVALDHKATEATEHWVVSDAPEHLATWNAFEEAAQTIRNLAAP